MSINSNSARSTNPANRQATTQPAVWLRLDQDSSELTHARTSYSLILGLFVLGALSIGVLISGDASSSEEFRPAACLLDAPVSNGTGGF